MAEINLNEINSIQEQVNQIQNDNWWNITDTEASKVDLRNMNTMKDKERKIHKENYRRNLIISTIVIVITTTLSIIWFLYDKYIVDYWNWKENTHEKLFNTLETINEKIHNLIWLEYSHEVSSINLVWDNGKENLNNLINWNNWYIRKKETIKNSIPNLISSIKQTASDLEIAQRHVTTNSYFADDLNRIISENEQISSIQDSLTALEWIKFNSAINVFYYLDTFIDSLSKENKISKDEIKTKIKDIIKRWEKDINLYIKNCYLNAYELDYNCNTIWDFNKYYSMVQDNDFDTNFFKSLIKFIDSKLEQEEIPSFSIIFKWLNKSNNELTFDVEINTFKEDEMELAKEWILSPHLFILNNLVNALKLSRSIISEDIEVKTLDTVQRTIQIWITDFTVNTSTKSFSVPIQNSSLIEIWDNEF